MFGIDDPIRDEDRIEEIEAGDRIIADLEGDGERGVGVFEAEHDGRLPGFSVSPEGSSGTGRLTFTTSLTQGGRTELPDDEPVARLSAGDQRLGEVHGVRVTNDRECEPLGIGRERDTGLFQPPSRVQEPEVDPIIDVCRDPESGRFDRF